MIDLSSPAVVTSVKISGAIANTMVEIRSASVSAPQALSDTTLLASAALKDGDTTISIPDAAASGTQTSHVLVWITGLPLPKAAQIGDVTISGRTTATSTSVQPSSEPAIEPSSASQG